MAMEEGRYGLWRLRVDDDADSDIALLFLYFLYVPVLYFSVCNPAKFGCYTSIKLCLKILHR